MINRWNSVVSKRDTVFHLGDFSFCNFDKTQEIYQKLNGIIHIIMGNHCRDRSINWFRNIGFYQVYRYPICFNNSFWLSHEPMELDNESSYINIHGHIHSRGRMKQFEHIISATHHICVCTENIDYTPILLEDLIKYAPHNHKIKEVDISSFKEKKEKRYE